jgi:nitroimidazol reductase NimA-like FMN-containing flavoprotein (pyridoxamine 5'-phosphate oxidase superfamily)
MENLTEAECWALLTTTTVGRIAVALDDGVDIFPLNFVAKDRYIYFRSAPGSKLVELTANPVVAFEADGRRRLRRWSVVVRGEAKRLDDDDEIEKSGVRELRTTPADDKWNYVRITPRTVTGRRFQPQSTSKS